MPILLLDVKNPWRRHEIKMSSGHKVHRHWNCLFNESDVMQCRVQMTTPLDAHTTDAAAAVWSLLNWMCLCMLNTKDKKNLFHLHLQRRNVSTMRVRWYINSVKVHSRILHIVHTRRQEDECCVKLNHIWSLNRKILFSVYRRHRVPFAEQKILFLWAVGKRNYRRLLLFTPLPFLFL